MIPIYVPAHRLPSKKGYTPRGANYVLFRVDPLSEGDKTMNEDLCPHPHHENIPI